MTDRGASRYFCHYITGTHSSPSATAPPPALVLAVGGIFPFLPLDYSPFFLLRSWWKKGERKWSFQHYITGTHTSLSATAMPPAFVIIVGRIFWFLVCLETYFSWFRSWWPKGERKWSFWHCASQAWVHTVASTRTFLHTCEITFFSFIFVLKDEFLLTFFISQPQTCCGTMDLYSPASCLPTQSSLDPAPPLSLA